MKILPLAHFVRLIRRGMLLGAELMKLRQDVLALIVFTRVVLTLIILRFSKGPD